MSGSHGVELGFLEVRRDPDVVGDEHGQRCSRLCELTDCGAEIDDTPWLGCGHRRIGKVQLRLVALGLGLREARLGTFALRLQRLELPFGELQVGLRARQCRLLLTEL